MQIVGLQKTTLLDYPGKVAATVFTRGCNFRCPYCHNMNLVDPRYDIPVIPTEEIFSFLNKRKNLLEGVCITGGEPTINPELCEFIERIKGYGLSVKLDTNGTAPGVLELLIKERLIDYAAMDIKASPAEYGRVAGISDPDMKSMEKSIELLLKGTLPYEFRTTVVRKYHTAEVFDEIGAMIAGCDNYYLQSFTDSEFVTDHTLTAYDKEELLNIVRQLEKYNITAYLRGV